MTKGISSGEARARLGVHSAMFARLVRAGVYRRDRFGLFDLASLHQNHAAAVEIERVASAQIAMVQRATARRIAALGAPSQPERKLP